MAQVDPNIVATAGVQDLQTAIDKLAALRMQPDSDDSKINPQIEALESNT